MPGVLNIFFASFHKKFGFFEKIKGLLFFGFDNCGPFEVGTGQMSPVCPL